ncbi:MAG: radical SAM protein, partial [Caldilineaceae bacterium]|nr:radical SAM protein [Caldilineaceae bacterium]
MAATWEWPATGDPLYVSLAAGALTLSFAGRASVSFDGAGRLLGAWFDGITYRRSLDNRVLAKWIDPAAAGTRVRRFLSEDERRALVERAYAAAADVVRGLASGALETSSSPAAWNRQVQAWLSVVAGWSWDGLQGDACRFHTIYKPVSILPPDQYMALVLQATEGCSYNLCTFCTFYRDRPFRIKSVEEFAAHCDQVRDFLGAGIGVRRSIFLADANAVIAPQRLLLPMLDAVNARFPVRAPGAPRGASWELEGVYAFVSAPDALRKRAEDFAALRERGMRRLYVGLETGHDPLRAFLAKPGRAAEVVEAVATMKAGGMEIGVIFMLGIGGEAYR